MSMTFPFIVIEGLPGVGKTTVRDRLVNALAQRAVAVHHVGQHGWLDPSATRTIVDARKGTLGVSPSSLTDALLTDKAAHLAANVGPYLCEHTVIADRFYLSDLCLLGMKNAEIFKRYISGVRIMQPLPTLIVLLSAPVAEVERRLKQVRKFRRSLDRPDALIRSEEVLRSPWPERLGLPIIRVENSTKDDLVPAVDLVVQQVDALIRQRGTAGCHGN